jgi:NADH:ubiquinone reductase (non-electrogenic)
VGKHVVVCESVLNNERYEVSYDKLVIAVGARSNTFNVPGVEKHAFFLKEIAHARAIRNRILTNFELSVHPNITRDEEKRLLHFVICGGGPTGVEFGAELYDFLREDVSRLYSQEKDKVQVTLIEPHQILPSFDKKLRAFAEKKIKQRSRFNLIQSGVVQVEEGSVTLQNGTILPCGLVVWSTGLAPRPAV